MGGKRAKLQLSSELCGVARNGLHKGGAQQRVYGFDGRWDWQALRGLDGREGGACALARYGGLVEIGRVDPLEVHELCELGQGRLTGIDPLQPFGGPALRRPKAVIRWSTGSDRSLTFAESAFGQRPNSATLRAYSRGSESAQGPRTAFGSPGRRSRAGQSNMLSALEGQAVLPGQPMQIPLRERPSASPRSSASPSGPELTIDPVHQG